MQLVKNEPQDHKIARFKAKYGVSNRVMGNLLNISAIDVKNKTIDDSFTLEQNDLVFNVEGIVERLVKESDLLRDQAPYLMVLEHEKEMQARQIDNLEKANKLQGVELLNMKSMGLWKRFIFLFRPKK